MLIHPYQSSWKNDFEQIRKVIQTTLANLDITIEHVGSTAVPQLAAKAIIDIDIIFPPEVNFDDIRKGLESLKYFHNGNQGIHDRDVFKRKPTNSKHKILDKISHHLYVCPVHSEELKKHLLFRDFLRRNEKERKEYEVLKMAIAEEANQNKKQYAHIKEIKARSFINSILEKANQEINQLKNNGDTI